MRKIDHKQELKMGREERVLPGQVPDGNPYYVEAVTQMGEKQDVRAQEDIYAASGMKLLAKGAQVNRSHLTKLTQHKLRVPLDCVLSSERQLDVASLAADIALLLERDEFLLRMAARSGDVLAIKHALAGIILPRTITFRLTVMKMQRPELFEHSLRCLLIAHMLLLRMHKSLSEQEAMIASSLCHDLGEMHTDPTLLAPGRRISTDERRFIHVHPVTGYVLLRDLTQFPLRTLETVLQHHERLDGSGYPNGLREARMTPLAKVMAVVEVAGGMVQRLQLRRMEIMLKFSNSRFHREVVRALHELLPKEIQAYDAGSAEEHLEEQFTRLAQALNAWEVFSRSLEDQAAPESKEQGRLAFLFERMGEVRSMALQAGINVHDFSLNLGIARGDNELLGELRSALDELNWRLTEIANEIELRAPAVNPALKPALDHFVLFLRRIAAPA